MTVDSPHRLFMADWKDQDGGVVIRRFLPFCRCGWSPMFGTRDEEKALGWYRDHESGRDGSCQSAADWAAASEGVCDGHVGSE